MIRWIKAIIKTWTYTHDQKVLIFFAVKQLDTKKDLAKIEMKAAQLSVERMYALFDKNEPKLARLEFQLKQLVKERNEAVKMVQEFDKQLWMRVIAAFLDVNDDATVLKVMHMDKQKLMAGGVDKVFHQM